MRTLFAIFALVLGYLPLRAQEAPSTAHIDSMAWFSFMEGHWDGIAVITMRDGHRDTIYQHEDVAYLLGGTILNTEGRGTNSAGELVFNAFATMCYDVAAKRYRMFAFRDNGQVAEAEIERLGPGEFYWFMRPNDDTVIRYHTIVKEGTWTETGGYSYKGSPFTAFFEMHLTQTH